jgi:hypothetical protein
MLVANATITVALAHCIVHPRELITNVHQFEIFAIAAARGVSDHHYGRRRDNAGLLPLVPAPSRLEFPVVWCFPEAGNRPDALIYRLLQNMPMGPEEIGRLTTAYEQALRAIGIVDRADPLAELLARKIIEVAQAGIREPADISAQAIKEIGIPT